MHPRSLPTVAAVLIAVAGCGPDTPNPTDPADPGPASAPRLAVASNTWITRPDLLSNQQSGMTAATLTNALGQTVVYVIGGRNATGGSYSKVFAYNAATSKWIKKTPLPIALYHTNGAAVVNGRIYVSGGINAPRVYSDGLFVYDPATNSWTRKRSMPAPGYWGVSGAINGKLYVLTYCGGEDCFPVVREAFYRYDPATDRWSTLPLPAGYHGLGAGGVIGGKLYVAGGGSSKQLEVYDPATNAWTTKAPLGSERWLTAGTVVAGKLYVIGGLRRDPLGITVVPTTSVYDPATDTWTHKARLPSPMSDFAAGRVIVNGTARVDVFGGAPPGNHLELIP
jgi:N-acetylneuraminic acid mutarotase